MPSLKPVLDLFSSVRGNEDVFKVSIRHSSSSSGRGTFSPAVTGETPGIVSGLDFPGGLASATKSASGGPSAADTKSTALGAVEFSVEL